MSRLLIKSSSYAGKGSLSSFLFIIIFFRVQITLRCLYSFLISLWGKRNKPGYGLQHENAHNTTKSDTNHKQLDFTTVEKLIFLKRTDLFFLTTLLTKNRVANTGLFLPRIPTLSFSNQDQGEIRGLSISPSLLFQFYVFFFVRLQVIHLKVSKLSFCIQKFF